MPLSEDELVRLSFPLEVRFPFLLEVRMTVYNIFSDLPVRGFIT